MFARALRAAPRSASRGSVRRFGAPSVTAPASEPTWTSTVPAISFVQGAEDTHSMLPYMTNFNSSLHVLSNSAGTLPAGVTLNPADGYVYDGAGAVASPVSMELTIMDTAEADWIARSTAAGVTYAQDFRNAAAVTPFFFDNGAGEVAAGYISVRTAGDALTGGNYLRLSTPTGYGGTQAAVFRHPLNSAWTSNSQHFGTTPFEICWRMRVNAERLSPSTPGQGWKFLNVAQFNHTNPADSASNTTAEIVGQDSYHRGIVQAYFQNGVSFDSWETFGPGGDVNFQPALDNGAGLPNADRYCIYNGGAGSAGCFRFVADEWLTLKMRIKYGTYGSSTGHEFALYAARPNAMAWTTLINATGFALGVPESGYGGSNGLHWHIYETSRSGGPGGIVDYDQIIVSTNVIALPGVGA